MEQSNVEMEQSNVEMEQSNVEMEQSNVEIAQSNVEIAQSNVEMKQSNVEIAQSNVEMEQSNVDICGFKTCLFVINQHFIKIYCTRYNFVNTKARRQEGRKARRQEDMKNRISTVSSCLRAFVPFLSVFVFYKKHLILLWNL